MATREDLADWVCQALHGLNGQATLVNVARHIWEHHEDELRRSGDLFYTWQYEMRWAGQRLRDQGRLTLVGREWAFKK